MSKRVLKRNWILAAWLGLAAPAFAQDSATALLRTEGPLFGMRINRLQTMMAFTDENGRSLRVMDLKTHEIVEISPHRIGTGFFWSPDGLRIFYRELIRGKQGGVTSEFKAYDSYLNRSVAIDSIEGSTGMPTLDPRDYMTYIMHEKGILAKRLEFPGERFGKWQGKKKSENGAWVASQKSILWLSDMGLTMRPLADDGSGVESFDISPDGKRIAWATKQGRIFTSEEGKHSIALGLGRDPRWHPSRTLLLYAGARQVGDRAYDYDIRISDPHGHGRFVSITPDRAERWPQWWTENSVIFTVAGTTDVWELGIRPDLASKASHPQEKMQ